MKGENFDSPKPLAETKIIFGRQTAKVSSYVKQKSRNRLCCFYPTIFRYNLETGKTTIEQENLGYDTAPQFSPTGIDLVCK
jgi:hypothetical protein